MTHAARSCAGRRSSDEKPVALDLPIRNINRTVGTILSSEITRRYGRARLAAKTPSSSTSAAPPGKA